MLIKKIKLIPTALVLSVIALLTSSEISAHSCHRHNGCRVEAAQANYQDETTFTPAVDEPIPFSVANFRTNVDVNSDNTVFEVEVPGLYSLDAFLLVNVTSTTVPVEGYITINGRELLTFFNEERPTATGNVEFHFEDRLVYLRKGDRISVVLSDFPPGTTVLGRGFVMIAYNNSR